MAKSKTKILLTLIVILLLVPLLAHLSNGAQADEQTKQPMISGVLAHEMNAFKPACYQKTDFL